jgi:hypothetical protein
MSTKRRVTTHSNKKYICVCELPFCEATICITQQRAEKKKEKKLNGVSRKRIFACNDGRFEI